MLRDEKPLSGHDSLLIIQQMIDAAKQEQKGDGKGWILWGWLLLGASVGTIFNLQYRWLNTFFFWNAFGIAAVILGIFAAGKVIFFKKTDAVKTYTSEIFKKLNAGFFISLLFLILATNVGVGPLKGFPLMMSLYGFWSLIHGALVNFKPSIIGAYIMWALAFIALFIPLIIQAPANDQSYLFTWVMVLHAIGVICCYLIPGHMANNEFRKNSTG